MGGIFNTGLSFWQLVVLLAAFTASVIAVKITFNFDLNKFLDRRDKRLDKKIKNTCTHIQMEFIKKDERGMPEYKIQSLFESPPGTHQWQCQKCGLVRNHNNDYEEQYEYYAENADEYIKRNRKFQKLIKKAGAV